MNVTGQVFWIVAAVILYSQGWYGGLLGLAVIAEIGWIMEKEKCHL